MVANIARLTQKITEALLGGLGIAVQAGNVLICVALILFAFGIIVINFPTPA